MKKELGIFSLLVVLCIIVSILNPRFLAGANLQNMARLIGAYGIFSIGIGIVIITGGIDLSVGSVFALLGVLLSILLTEWQWAAALAVLVVVGIAMGLGFVHGLLITRLSLQPFIVTLCGLLFYRGTMFPERYRGGAFIAFHGSWNRAPMPQAGYKVVFVPRGAPGFGPAYETFAAGFAGGNLDPGGAVHRPVGLGQGPDGALYITDDQRGRIWRVTWEQPR